MKSSDAAILVIAGHAGYGPEHWQSRLIAKLPSAKLVGREDWLYDSLDSSVNALVQSVAAAVKPVVFVAHSAGCTLLAHSVSKLQEAGLILHVKGAYLVVPPSPEGLDGFVGLDTGFKTVPRERLPFPSVFVASSNDPHSTMQQSRDLALTWGSELVEAGEAGHINAASGHGPWPEGLMRFAGFLSKLS